MALDETIYRYNKKYFRLLIEISLIKLLGLLGGPRLCIQINKNNSLLNQNKNLHFFGGHFKSLIEYLKNFCRNFSLHDFITFCNNICYRVIINSSKESLVNMYVEMFKADVFISQKILIPIFRILLSNLIPDILKDNFYTRHLDITLK